MPVRIARGAITANRRYGCLFCRLQTSSHDGGRTTRYIHTLPENDGGHTNQESPPKNARNRNEAVSQSRIHDILRQFMFKSGAKDKETMVDSRIESLGKSKQSPPIPESISTIAPQAKDNADVLAQNLQQKFSAQRRKDMLAMQVGQASMTVEEDEKVPEAPSAPETTKPRQKNGYKTRAEKSTKRRKLQKTKETKKPSKQTKAKPIKVPREEVAEITASAEPQTAEEPSTGIEASVKDLQELLGVKGKEVDGSDSNGNVPGEQTTTARNLNDTTDISESSKNKNLSKTLVKEVRSLNFLKAAGVAAPKELQNSEERLNLDSLKTAAVVAHYSRRLLAYLKAHPEKKSESLHVLKELLARKATSNTPATLSAKTGLRPHTLKPSFRIRRLEFEEKPPTNDAKISTKSSDVPNFISPKAALGQGTKKIKATDVESLPTLPSKKVRKIRIPPRSPPQKAKKSKALPKSLIEKITASDLEILPIKVDQPPVPNLAYGLDRVLFNPGVYQLQDPRSRVYNFDPYLQKIMPVTEFDFTALKEYITSSRDQSLIKIAKEHGKRYMGSTSSMTGVLAHFHFLLSQWRPINTSMLSKDFPVDMTTFTWFQRIPSAIFLRWKDGSYAIDADKQFDTANVLMSLGKSMEKLLTLNTDDFERYRKSNSGQVTEDEQSSPESYHYSTLGDFLMRSQLDAYDPRLPGTGMFDLKTRSVVSIRMDVANFEHGVGYEIKTRQGDFESYEREYYDLIRAAFLKYSLQVRMGRMDGIFVAFHNIERIFGFQYISLPEMDSTLHGQWDTSIGDQEFRLSLDLLNKVLDRATKKHPETSLRIHFETRETQTPFMYIFAEPVTEEQVVEIQSHNSAKIQEYERRILGLISGNGTEADDPNEGDSKWENIQADVQEAMDQDELSVDEPGQDQEVIDEDTEGSESAPDRPEVFEQGPLYASKSPAGTEDGVTTASVGSENFDADSEDDNVDDEEEREDEEGEEYKDWDGDADEDGEVDEIRRQEGIEEIIEVKADLKANDAIEAEQELGGDGAEENDVAPNEDYPVEVQNNADLLTEGSNEDVTLGATSEQKSVDEAAEPTNGKDGSSIWPDAQPSSISEGEGQQEYPIQADQGFLDSIEHEVAQSDTAGRSPSTPDILAMTLTLRNKVNGEYVLRPESITKADEWSIEYSLAEVSEQPRARALYGACLLRRSKKTETPLVPENAEHVPAYIQKLRQLSRKGRAWRTRQDEDDGKKPVQVL